MIKKKILIGERNKFSHLLPSHLPYVPVRYAALHLYRYHKRLRQQLRGWSNFGLSPFFMPRIVGDGVKFTAYIPLLPLPYMRFAFVENHC